MKTSLVVIRITFEGNINQSSVGNPFAQQSFKSNENCWANKIFGTETGQLNEYWQEVSNGKFMLYPARETYGTANDGTDTCLLCTATMANCAECSDADTCIKCDTTYKI